MSSDQTGTRWRRMWRSFGPAGIVLLIGVTATLCATAALRGAEHQSATNTLTRRGQDARIAVNAEATRYVDAVRDLSAAAASQSQVTEANFATITSPIRHDRLPGVGAVVFAGPDGAVRHGRAVDRSDRAGRVVAPDADGPELRLVMGAEARTAMLAAQRSGETTASEPLPQRDPDTGRTYPALVFAEPVQAGPTTADAGSFRGWMLVTVRTDGLLEQAMAPPSQRDTVLGLSDVTDPARPVTLAGTWSRVGSSDGATSHRTDLVVAHRTWQLAVRATGPMVSGPGRYAAESALGAGLLITALLVGASWLLATSRERALAGVQQATAALRADIARREAVEAQLRDREAELAGFIAVTAHDLRTPMTNVSAYADLLAEVAAEDLDPTCQGFVQRIGTGTRRMTRIIDDLLDFATANNAPLRPETIDLHTLVAEVISEHTAHLGDARPNVDIGSLPTVQGDPATLTRLLDNLVGNAIKYVRHGDTAQISIGSRREPAGWRIEVADRGIGIPQEQRDAVFAAFHRDRAAEGYPGTGLGLAICKRIVERHGGHIGVEANPGGGSRFWFTLPETLPVDLSEAEPVFGVGVGVGLTDERVPAKSGEGNTVEPAGTGPTEPASASPRRSADPARRRSAAGPS